MPAISLIIPLYNAEKYLRPCLDSAKNQTFEDIEIIALMTVQPTIRPISSMNMLPKIRVSG